jgi:sec-independent protein translocase protein TatC
MSSLHRSESDDYFADTRMTFGDHLEELRTRLIRALMGFGIALIFGFLFGWYVLRFISAPVEQQLAEFYEDRVQAVDNGLDAGDPELKKLNQPIELKMTIDGKEVTARINEPLRLVINLHKAQQVIGRRPALSTLSVQEAFMAYVKVAVATGFVLGSPWIFWQIWLFVAAGLYPTEKRLVNVYLPFSLGLFLVGVLICQL